MHRYLRCECLSTNWATALVVQISNPSPVLSIGTVLRVYSDREQKSFNNTYLESPPRCSCQFLYFRELKWIGNSSRLNYTLYFSQLLLLSSKRKFIMAFGRLNFISRGDNTFTCSSVCRQNSCKSSSTIITAI